MNFPGISQPNLLGAPRWLTLRNMINVSGPCLVRVDVSLTSSIHPQDFQQSDYSCGRGAPNNGISRPSFYSDVRGLLPFISFVLHCESNLSKLSKLL